MTDLSLPYLAGYAIPHGFLLLCLALPASSRRKAKRIRRARQVLWAVLEGPAPSGEVTVSGIIDGSKDDGAALAVEVVERRGRREVVRVVYRPIWLQLDDERLIHLELEGDAEIDVSLGRDDRAQESGGLRTSISFQPGSRMTVTGLLGQASGGGPTEVSYREQAPRLGLASLPGKPLRVTERDEGLGGESFAVFCCRLFAAFSTLFSVVCVPFYLESILDLSMPKWLKTWQCILGAAPFVVLSLFAQGWMAEERFRVRVRLGD